MMPQDNPYARYAQRQPQAITIGQPDPYRDDEQRRAEEDQAMERERIRIAQQNAAVSAANSNRPPAGYRWAADGSLEVIPGGPADKAADTEADDEISERQMKLGQLRTLLEQIDRVEELYRGNLEGGFPNGISGRVPGIIRPENEQFASAAAGMAEQGLAAFRVPGVGSQSDNELRQFVEANRPLPSDSDLAIEEKLRQIRNRVRVTLDAWGIAPDELNVASSPSETSTENRSTPAAGSGANEQSLEIPGSMQEEHAQYLRDNWGSLDPDAYARFRAGLDAEYGFQPNMDAYRSVVPSLNERAAGGGAPDGLSIPRVNAPLEGGEAFLNDLVANPFGAGVASYANSAGFGIPSLLAGDQMEALREAEPVGSMIGDIGGGITGTILGGNALGALSGKVASPLLSNMLANPVAADVAYGGIYGATQSDDPLTGAGVGVASALVGNVIGSQIGKRIPSAVGVRRPADSLSRGERAVFDAVEDIDPVIAALTQASDLNVPATIADVSGEVNSLTGAALRRSPSAAAGARDMLGRRADGQYDRLLAAIERDLGPIENIPQRSEDLITRARTQAAPLYDAAYVAPGASVVQIDDLASRPSMRKALNNAARIAQEEGRDPAQLGFVFDEAGNATMTRQPSWQTLDYVKRGLDDVLEGYRDRTTGRLSLDTEGKAVNDTLRELLSRMDTANPDYAAARAAYAGPAAERDAMRRGQEAMRMSPNQLGVNVANASPSQVEQMQMGFRSGLADRAGSYRNSSNPFAVLNNPAMEQRLDVLYPGADTEIARLLAQRDLEAQMAGSANRLVGNSLTAERQVADEAFSQNSLAGDMVQGGLETLVTGAPVATAVRSAAGRGFGTWARDARTFGVGRRAVELADEIPPITLNPDPAASAAELRALADKDAAHAAIVEALMETARERGARAGAGAAAVLTANGVE